MKPETFKHVVGDCLTDLGLSFTTKDEHRLSNAENALEEARTLLKLSEGLVETCSARVCMLGGTSKT